MTIKEELCDRNVAKHYGREDVQVQSRNQEPGFSCISQEPT